jgi:hypothetical protein
MEHSTLNRLVVGSIPTASTTLLPIYQALTVTGSFSPAMRFPKLTKLFFVEPTSIEILVLV